MQCPCGSGRSFGLCCEVYLQGAKEAESIEALMRWGNTSQISIAEDGNTMVFVNDAINRPGQLYTWSINAGASPQRLTDLNAAMLSQLRMNPAEDISWVGADGNTVRGMLVRPPQYQRGQRYPLLVMIHGGPQGAGRDNWRSPRRRCR